MKKAEKNALKGFESKFVTRLLRRKFPLFTLVLFLLFLLCFSLGSLFWFTKIKEETLAYGVIKPLHQIRVETTVSGVIQDVLVKEGDLVRKGQILIKLQENREKSELTLPQTDILAPVDGIIVASNLEKKKGLPIEAGTTLLSIADLNEIVVEFEIDKEDMSKFRLGQEVEIFINIFPHEEWNLYKGEIVKIGTTSEITDRGILLPVIIKFKYLNALYSSDLRKLIEMLLYKKTVKMKLITRTRRAFTIILERKIKIKNMRLI